MKRQSEKRAANKRSIINMGKKPEEPAADVQAAETPTEQA
jgi:hypothetical protein